MSSSQNLMELLKNKPVSKTRLKIGVELSDKPLTSTTSNVFEMQVKLTDKSDPDNIKREQSFKERIKQMKTGNLLAVKARPKTKQTPALVPPIRSFSKDPMAPPRLKSTDIGDGESKTQSKAISLTRQKMEELREKRRKKREEREKKKIQKLLESRKIQDKRQLEMDKTALKKRKADVSFKVDNYFLNNRETFVNFIEKKLYGIKNKRGDDKEIKSCDELNAYKRQGQFSLLLHQEIVKEYLNIYSPYRGLFLYFGLGAGKTCGSIAIAEGLKDFNKIVVMTPASLEQNYMNELKFCGDDIFKKNHHWEFINNVPENAEKIEELTKILNLPVDVIRKNNGIWAINTSPPSSAGNIGNYGKLSALQQKSLNNQLDAMIKNKYEFIHYNGLRDISKYEARGVRNGGNFFNNKVVIIDEVHNFVGTISNQLGNEKSFNYKLYNYLMDAENCKIVFLTGTPIINYPNEIAIFFNMLRGRIKTYEFKLITTASSKIKSLNTNYLRKILFSKNNEIDYLEFNNSSKKLTITRNPFNFVTRYKKAKDSKGNPTLINYSIKRKPDTEFDAFRNDGSYETVFLTRIIRRLEEKGIQVSMAKDSDCLRVESKDSVYNKVCIKKYKCLPDDYDTFTSKFIDPNTQELINKNIFKKRIMGLTSHFKAAVDALLPKFNSETDINEVYVDMSTHQLSYYNKVRDIEIGKEKSAGIKLSTTKDIYKNSSASYKIYSRECCNFTFPEGMDRPRPRIKKKVIADGGESKANGGDSFTQEALMNAAIMDTDEAQVNIEDDSLSNPGTPGSPDIDEFEDKTYKERVDEAVETIRANKDTLLTGENLNKHSPKFETMLNKIGDQVVNNDGQSTSHGTHLVYSFYNNVEGLGIFSMVLEANGYAQFKISNKNPEKQWKIDMDLDDLQTKPCYVLYSGNEKTDEKELLRLIFNGDWEKLPEILRNQLLSVKNRLLPPEDDTKVLNNFHGEIIKVFMITSAGAEGITLKNVRAVHLMEPYWHPVRFEQVIGRAVRICSHENLTENEQKVIVYIYLMRFKETHLKGDPNAEDEKMRKPLVSTLIMRSDCSKDKKRIITSDEKLYEISNIKKKINASILHAIKESSIDCKIHKKNGDNLQCFTISNPRVQDYLYNPNFEKDAPSQQEVKKTKLYPIKYKGTKYYLEKYDESSKKMRGILYDYNAYKKNKMRIKVTETGR